MLISMLVLRLACNGFEMDDISSEATTFKIWEFTSQKLSMRCLPATKYIQLMPSKPIVGRISFCRDQIGFVPGAMVPVGASL